MTDDQQQQPPDPDHQRWAYDLNIRGAERAHDQLDTIAQQINDATIQSGLLALRMSMLINGGAAISVLAFLGAIADKVDITQVAPITATIAWFAWGVAAAVFAMALGYMTNYCHVTALYSLEKSFEHPYIRPTSANRRWIILGNITHISAFIVGFASLALFICGMIQVRDAITQLPTSALLEPSPAPSPPAQQKK